MRSAWRPELVRLASVELFFETLAGRLHQEYPTVTAQDILRNHISGMGDVLAIMMPIAGE